MIFQKKLCGEFLQGKVIGRTAWGYVLVAYLADFVDAVGGDGFAGGKWSHGDPPCGDRSALRVVIRKASGECDIDTSRQERCAA